MASVQTLPIGSLLNNNSYRIEKVLGYGGFGITYLATDLSLDKLVAIKEFFPQTYCRREEATSYVTLGTASNSELVEKFKEKFLKEARTIARLNHPNIIKINTAFEQNDTAYYVMEYIEGKSLSDMVKTAGPIGRPLAIEYINKIGNALTYLHKHRMNHLDVKPANIMVRQSDNQPILIDFGLAKQYDFGGQQTSTTPVGVSHGYAPMEQSRPGGVAEFSPQTDLYSLAATLYYILSGIVPPEAHDLNETALTFPSSIPQELQPAIVKAMSPARVRRHESIAQFLQQLANPQAVTPQPSGEATMYYASQQPQANAQPQQPRVVITQQPTDDAQPEKSKKGMMGIIAAIGVLIVGLIIFFIFGLSGGSNKDGVYTADTPAQSADNPIATATKPIEKLTPTNFKTINNTLANQAGNSYVPKNMADNNPKTCWAVNLYEADYNNGHLWGPEMDINAESIDHIVIRNGYHKNKDMFNKNIRAADILIYRVTGNKYNLSDSDIIYEGPLKDVMSPQTLKVNPGFDNTRPTRSVGIAFSDNFDDYYWGTKYNDLSISELEFYGVPQ